MPLSRASAVVVLVINEENDDAATYIYILICIVIISKVQAHWDDAYKISVVSNQND